MKIKSLLAKPFSSIVHKQIKKASLNAIVDQQNIFNLLIHSAIHTVFGVDHQFSTIKNHTDYTRQVPIRDYEQFKGYIDQIKQGKQHVLWKGQPIYFAKTSGTTSGTKYIPITKDSISNHINTARNALLYYMAETGNTRFADGKLIFLSGSPELDRIGNIPTGRLSGIVNHHIPSYLRSNQMPSFETNCLEDWENKLDKIVDETIHQNMTLISGIPPWVQMYFDRLIEKSGKSIGDLFPNFNIMVQGGVNFEPYKKKLQESIGREIDILELYPASEGFFAFQDNVKQKGMLLNTNSGIFYEFIPVQEINDAQPTRLTLENVQIDVNYAIIISSNAGLWAYNIGDTIKFVSLNPYRIVVTGRIKQFISAFGEHVISEEVETATLKTCDAFQVKINEFTVAPWVSNNEGKSYHEWFIEFENVPDDLDSYALHLDKALRAQNTYYEDLIQGSILHPLKINVIKKGGFIEYMKSIGKLGGQNKVPRLSNDRNLADALIKYII